MNKKRGIVYLVGAGPGDPELITVRGLKLLRRADVVIHDRLIGRALLEEVPNEAEIVDVGKTPGDHRLSQLKINALMVDRAGRGLTVVRLKGGDPFVFGRGYEELTACREGGVHCVVVPGITSALAGPTAAGIPITCRELVRTLCIITAVSASESDAPPMDYSTLASVDTLVILMGRAKLAEIARELIDAGRKGSTPVACVEWATTPRQRVVVGTLETIAEAADREGLTAPVVTVVGEVAAKAEVGNLAAAWMDGQP